MSVPSSSYAAVEESVTYPAMSFRAIVAGWLVATGIAVLLYTGGLALGFSAFDAWHASASAKGIGIGTTIWVVLTWITSLFVGGLFASWFNAHDDQTTGSLHGVAVWGLSVAASALWVVLGFSSAMHHPSGTMSDDHAGADNAITTDWITEQSGSLATLKAEVTAQVQGHNRQVADPIVAALLANKDDQAARLLAADNGTTQATAAQSLQALAPDVNAAQIDLKTSAQRAAHYSAAAMWTLLISILLSLIAATLGGWLGAGHIQRVYHLRRFHTRTIRT
jgi:hypothetical protein